MAAYLRFPHLRGDTLVFVAENDVWTAPVSGGRAYRLTADDVPVGTPRLSPDGARVAWSSWREGAAEVFAADADGGSARRLTWWGGARCRGWTPSGDVLALTAAGQPLGRLTWAWDVPVDGGAPRRREHGPLSDLALSAGSPGVLLATTRSLESAWWKRYRGGTAAKLWWDADGSGEFVRLLAGIDAQLEAPMQVGERLAFLSDHEGWGNLYSVDRTGGDLRRHTDHGGPDAPAFYVRHASTDGTRVVYESAGELWILDSLDAESDAAARRLDVRLGGPRTAREPHRVTTSAWLSGAAPDRTGRTSVVTVRGTVHRLTHRDGPARTLLAEPGVRARLAEPLGDDLAVWVDDADGEETLTVAPVDPRADDAPPLVRHPIGGRVLQLAAAPDGNSVALTLHDGRLLLVDLSGDEAEVRELARGADGEISGLAWSPDSQWLAYADPVEAGISRIAVMRPADGVAVAVTEPRFVDRSPTFTTDGRYLAFLSRRSFDPIYDQHSFDLTFPASWRPFLVPLAARTPDPFGASPDGRPTSHADEKADDLHAPEPDDPSAEGAENVPKPDEGHEGADKDAPPEVVIDVDGLADRVVPIPVGEGRYSGMGAAKGCLLWYRSPVEGVLGSGPGRRREAGPARPRALRPGAAQARRDRGPGERVRGERRRHAARRARRRDAARAAVGPYGLQRAGQGRRRRVRDRHPADRRHRRPGRRVAADVRRGRPADARPLLGRRHGRGRLGGGAGPVPAAGRRGGQRRRPRRRAVGGQRRAGHVARVRVRGRRGRLVRAARAAGRRPRTRPTTAGGSSGCCRPRRRHRTRAARWPGRGSTCGPAT